MEGRGEQGKQDWSLTRMSGKEREPETKKKGKQHLGLKKATVEEVLYRLEASPEPGTRDVWGWGT